MILTLSLTSNIMTKSFVYVKIPSLMCNLIYSHCTWFKLNIGGDRSQRYARFSQHLTESRNFNKAKKPSLGSWGRRLFSNSWTRHPLHKEHNIINTFFGRPSEGGGQCLRKQKLSILRHSFSWFHVCIIFFFIIKIPSSNRAFSVALWTEVRFKIKFQICHCTTIV